MKIRYYICLIITLFCNISYAQVKTGIEVLRDDGFSILNGKRIALLTNPTGVDSRLVSSIDILHSADGVNLIALFAPEHGVRGDQYAGASVANSVDKRTNLPIYSLHGKTKKPTPAMLKGLDAIVYDIQDIGCRSYTFISSLGLLMEAAAENDVEVIVLDRPNPLGGEKVEGPLVSKGFFSFVSQFSIPYVYGLTCGELATLLNEEGMLKKKCKLTVVRMKGWSRSMRFEETGLPWVLTSPHIPQISSAVCYPVSGIAGELNSLSIGVGYTLPFETFAAPWINADSLAQALNGLHLDGIFFRPITYKPFYSMYKNSVVGGVQVHISDFAKANLTLTQFYVMQELHKLYPDKNPFTLGGLKSYASFDKVCGTDKVRLLFTKNFRVYDIEELWMKETETFRKLSRKYYLYD